MKDGMYMNLDTSEVAAMAREALASVVGHCSEGYETALYAVENAIEDAYRRGVMAERERDAKGRFV
jgi:hypothetical protein